jgi:hypothetical protein
MANHYLQYASNLRLDDASHVTWWREVAAFYSFDYESEEECKAAFKALTGIEELGHEFDDLTNFGLDCQMDVKDDGVFFYAEEYGNPDRVAALVRAFFIKFDLDWVFEIAYCFFCSKLWVGQFGGGSLYVTRDHIKASDEGDYAAALLSKGGRFTLLGDELELLRRLLREPLSDALSGGGEVSRRLASKLGMEVENG